MGLTKSPFVLETTVFLVGEAAFGESVLDLNRILALAEFLMVTELFRDHLAADLAVV